MHVVRRPLRATPSVVSTASPHSTFVAKPALHLASIGARPPTACVPNVQVGSTLMIQVTWLNASLALQVNGRPRRSETPMNRPAATNVRWDNTPL